MPDPHDSASFAALHDDASRDAAIARALGWRPAMLPEPDRCEHEPSHGYPIPCWVLGDVGPEPERDDTNVWWCDTPPPFYAGGDGDPFANWDLLAGVWKLLRTNGAGNAVVELLDWNGAGGCWWVSDEPGDNFRPMRDIRAEATTPHRAACLAAVAAGLVLKEGA